MRKQNHIKESITFEHLIKKRLSLPFNMVEGILIKMKCYEWRPGNSDFNLWRRFIMRRKRLSNLVLFLL